MAFVSGISVGVSGSLDGKVCLRRGAFAGVPVRSRVVRATFASGSAPVTMAMERTFIAIKPDGTNRGLIGEIISRFEKKGYKLVAMKALKPSKELAETHYDALKEKGFFPALVDFMCSGLVIAMVWEGKGVVATGRKMIGKTNPLDSEPGTIRGDYGLDVGRNVIHGSDAVETAEREIGIWFKPEDLVDWEPTVMQWIYE